MRISERFEAAAREDRIMWSFEYFPPRTAQGLQNLYDRIDRMRLLGPEFIDITWGAGGKNSDLTLNLIQVCQESLGVETCMHLCCTEMPAEKVKESLRIAKQHGCQNILALRGDPPNGQSQWTPTPGGFSAAIDLVRYIRAEYGDYFDIAVAGFPQGHPETPPGDDSIGLEITYLKDKVDAGANFIFTQMFYDVDIFLGWVRRVREAGITVPIVPGIMPIQNWAKFTTWVKRENIVVPPHFYEVLDPVKDDDEKVREVGTKLVAEMCRKILDAGVGVRALHVYTLNLEKGARMLLEEMELKGRREQVQPLPWRPSLTPHRRTESIRPIFWANRVQSYLSRTADWDEFPNGRWGDSRSPAYGDLDGYPVKIDITQKEAHELWGHPETLADIKSLFARFCRNDLRALPWSTQPPSKETSVIDQQLAKMNEMGYLTINSQPAVDGARSDDATHGWGPKNGYVYQKAYLEFFVAPDLLNELVRRIERDPRITYYAVNRQGDLRTNTHSEGPNAVTWGVFPGKEIIQPTIVEAVSFIAWKDEAFELGNQWARLYEEGSNTRDLIESVMSTSYLVNIVANDFRDGLSIFEPFQLDKGKAKTTPSPSLLNGVSHVAKAVAQQVVNGVTAATATASETIQAAVPSAKEAVSVSQTTKSHHDMSAPAKSSEATKVAEGKTAESVSQDLLNGVTAAASAMTSTAQSAASPPSSASIVEREPMVAPAGPAPRKRMTPADLDKVLETSPIFMRKAPEPGEENPAFDALRSLVFEGTGDEIATNFKNHGTENHVAGRYREALGFYSQGLEANPDDPQLKESLLLNRSACNLTLGNYRSVLNDTSEVLKGNPSHPKAFFRAASALVALSRWSDALDCISRGKNLATEATSDKQKAWIALEDKANKGLMKEQERDERVRRERLAKEALRRAILSRGVVPVTTPSPPDNPIPASFEHEATLNSVPLSVGVDSHNKWYPPSLTSPLIFPVFLLYPSHATSDFISRFHEDAAFEDQLEAMFPLTETGPRSTEEPQWAEWDRLHEYFCQNLIVYAETRHRKLLKVGKGLTLRDVTAKAAALPPVGAEKDGLVLRDGLLSFVVLVKGDAERKWIEEYKRSRG